MVEHRLQMVRDEQTHTMPRDRDELARIGRLMRYADREAFEAELRDDPRDGRATLLASCSKAPRSFRPRAAASSSPAARTIRRRWRRCGSSASQTPEKVTETVRGWHFGRFAAMRSTAARESLTEITPALLKAFSRAGNPDAAVRAFDSLLKALPAGAQLFALLRNNPDLLDLLATILSAAPRLAEIFARRPHVADALLDPRRLGGRRQARRDRARRSSEASRRRGRYEDVLDRARLFVAERRFLISVGLLNGTLAPADAGKAFSDLAEAIVRALLPAHARRSSRASTDGCRAGRPRSSRFGRLGSREMTAGSDLDLIVVYDHAPDAVSDGERPLAAVAILRAADAAADRGARRADRGGDRLRGRPAAAALRARRARSPRMSRPSSTIS